MVYSINGMIYEVELEPEVESWLDTLPIQHFAAVDRIVGRLAKEATTLDHPYTSHLGGKTRELRFRLGRDTCRISYWLAPRRRVVLLTVFRKTKGAEASEVKRATDAQKECERRHLEAAAHEYSRNITEGEQS